MWKKSQKSNFFRKNQKNRKSSKIFRLIPKKICSIFGILGKLRIGIDNQKILGWKNRRKKSENFWSNCFCQFFVDQKNVDFFIAISDEKFSTKSIFIEKIHQQFRWKKPTIFSWPTKKIDQVFSIFSDEYFSPKNLARMSVTPVGTIW